MDQPGPSKVNNKPIAEWPVRSRTPLVAKTPPAAASASSSPGESSASPHFATNLVLPPSLSLVPIVSTPSPAHLKTPSITFTRYDKPRPGSTTSTAPSGVPVGAKPVIVKQVLPIKPNITLTPITRPENRTSLKKGVVDTIDAVHKRLDPSADTVLSLLPGTASHSGSGGGGASETKSKREILGKLTKNLMSNGHSNANSSGTSGSSVVGLTGSTSGTMARVMQNPNLSISISDASSAAKSRVIPSPSLTVTDVTSKPSLSLKDSPKKDLSLSPPGGSSKTAQTTRSRRCVKKSAKVLENEQTAALLAHEDVDPAAKAREREASVKLKKKTGELLKKPTSVSPPPTMTKVVVLPVPAPPLQDEKTPVPVVPPPPSVPSLPHATPVPAPPPPFTITPVHAPKAPIYVSKIIDPVPVPEPDVTLVRVPRALPPLPPLVLKRYDVPASEDSSEEDSDVSERDLVDHRLQTRSTVALKRKKASLAKKKKGKKKKRFSYEEDLSIDPRFGGKSITEKVKEKVKSGRDRRGEAPPPAPMGGGRGRSLRGPYVHIEGRWLAPRKVDVVNGAEKEEGNVMQVLRPTWPYVDAEHRLRAAKVGYTSTLSEKYDAINRDPTWVCVFCGQWTHVARLGDLFGPYYVRKVKPVKKREKRAWSEEEEEDEENTEELEVWFHEHCVVWAADVVLIGPRMKGLGEAVADASISDCSVCAKKGATIECRQRHCALRSHYPCAVSKAWRLDEETFHVLCPEHSAPPLPEAADHSSKRIKELERNGEPEPHKDKEIEGAVEKSKKTSQLHVKENQGAEGGTTKSEISQEKEPSQPGAAETEGETKKAENKMEVDESETLEESETDEEEKKAELVKKEAETSDGE